MKAALAVCALLGLTACSIATVPKPTATATLHWHTVQLKLGSYCWSSGGQGECADSAGADALLRTGYLVPERTAGCQSALIKFSTEPQTFEVQLVYSTTGKTGSVASEDHAFDIGSTPGTYVYVITGTWSEGDVGFYLPLEIIPGCE